MKRLHIHVTGIVQGVGFRPFVYNLAKSLNLKGWVLNSSEGVHIEIEGNEDSISNFLRLLEAQKPPRAEIEQIKIEELEPYGFTDFEIRESEKAEHEFILISPDIATCKDCVKELFDPNDRRYRYPFINCTNCGPRFTIIEEIPYDRPRTTMKKFKMCPDCKNEYHDPANRRFHAQPNACHICGPQLMFIADKNVFQKLNIKAKPLSEIQSEKLADYGIENIENTTDYQYLEKEDALRAAEELIRKGYILALKGLGGFHLACLAENFKAVERLRERKKRPSKAFAVMFAGIRDLREVVELNEEAEEILTSPVAPILLLPKKYPEKLAENIAPGLSEYGVMLPSTPLHHLLLSDIQAPLVMTSGNLSEEPIARDNKEAIERLSGIADGFLIHNRDIYSRYDDSVIKYSESAPIIIRRARSIAPYPLKLKTASKARIFGAGPELKCTFTLIREDYAFVSQHIGDLSDELTLQTYLETYHLYKKLFRIEPEVFSCDLHPDYLSTKVAEEISAGKDLFRIQHHFAHIASVMGEYDLKGPVIGFAFDGTGYGADGTVWGGEVIIAEKGDFQRVARFRPFALPGGDAAIKNPYRVAVSVLLQSGFPEEAQRIAGEELKILDKMIQSKRNTPLTSSTGRLFDAVASILDVGREATYEGELAMRLEAQASALRREISQLEPYEFGLQRKGELIEIEWMPIIQAIIEEKSKKISKTVIAAKFHLTLAEIIHRLSVLLNRETGIRDITFSGGVFQNSILVELVKKRMAQTDFKLYFHRLLPPNDACISFGQTFTVMKLLD